MTLRLHSMRLALTVSLLALSIVSVRASVSDGLMGWWTLDQGSGTSEPDSSVNGNNGTLVGSPLPQRVKGQMGNALQFDGIQNYVQLPDLHPTDQISISVWIYPVTGGSIVERINGYGVRMDTDQKIYALLKTTDNGYGYQAVSPSISLNQWHHIATTYVSGSNKLYVDGVMVQENTAITGDLTYDPYGNITTDIGAENRYGFGNFFGGSVDDVRIYNRVLSAQEISDIYTQGLSGVAAGDTIPPSLSAGLPTGVLTANTSSTTLHVTTDKNATCKYDTDAQKTFDQMVYTFGTTGGTAHSTVINGLQNNTAYIYHMRCETTNLNPDTTDFDISFSVAPGTTPPVISNVDVPDLSQTTARVTWSTDVGATSQIEYGPTTSYGSSSSLDSTLATLHSQTLSNLTADTTYHFRIHSVDVSNNESVSTDQVFKTAQLIVASHFYIAQSTAGNGSGSASCADAESIDWVNATENMPIPGSIQWAFGVPSHWAGPYKPTEPIGPGTTLHFCGPLSTSLTVLGSGTPGNPVTILFEQDAKFSAPIGAGINLNKQNYITVDGGINGVIEATDIGSPDYINPLTGNFYGYQVNAIGVLADGSDHVVIQNLTIRNLYVRDPGSTTDTNRAGEAISVQGSNIVVRNNVLTGGDTMIGVGYGPGTYTNVTVDSNTIGECNHGMFVDTYQNNSGTFSNLTISNNRIDKLDVWNGVSGNHLDGMIISIDTPDGSGILKNLQIFNNHIGPRIGNINTGAIYISGNKQGQYPGLSIYNNLLTAVPPYYWTNGFIKSGGNIYNNTIIGLDGGIGVNFLFDDTIIKNNVFYGCGVAMHNSAQNASVDFNLYYWQGGTSLNNIIHDESGGKGEEIPFLQWQNSLGFDKHSLVSDPLLVNVVGGDYHPTPSSPLILAGTNLASICGDIPSLCADYDQKDRPASGHWDLGAYQYRVYVPPSTFTLTVTSGTILPGGATSGSFPAGAIIAIQANTSPNNIFYQWIGAAVQDSRSSLTTLVMPAADTTLIASFGIGTGSSGNAQFLTFKNVFNPTKEPLTIKYTLNGTDATLKVYDRLGNEIRTLADGTNNGSGYQTSWDGRNSQGSIVASGTYILVLKQGGTTVKKKVVVVK